VDRINERVIDSWGILSWEEGLDDAEDDDDDEVVFKGLVGTRSDALLGIDDGN
jgi:hypothetical protein